MANVVDAADAFTAFAEREEWTPMPGYTHMQRAMLSSVGLWASAFAESLLDDLALLKTAYHDHGSEPARLGGLVRRQFADRPAVDDGPARLREGAE